MHKNTLRYVIKKKKKITSEYNAVGESLRVSINALAFHLISFNLYKFIYLLFIWYTMIFTILYYLYIIFVFHYIYFLLILIFKFISDLTNSMATEH